MKIIIFGATGKTGQHVLKQSLEQGYEVTVFVRSRKKLSGVESNLHIVQGNVFDSDAVAKAVSNHDAAIICLGSSNLHDKTTLTTGTKNVVDGMIHHNVKRLVIISTAGVEESWNQISWSSRFLFKTLLRNIFLDHKTQEAIVKDSPLEWVIVRSAVLTDKSASGVYTASNTKKVGRISRADLANFLVKQVTNTTYLKQAISVTS